MVLAEAEREVEPPPALVGVFLRRRAGRGLPGVPYFDEKRFARHADLNRQQRKPFEIGERRALYLPVNILTMSDRSVMCYAESQGQGHLDRESTSVVPMLIAYQQLQAEALPQADSVAMIQKLRKGTL